MQGYQTDVLVPLKHSSHYFSQFQHFSIRSLLDSITIITSQRRHCHIATNFINLGQASSHRFI